MKQYEKAEYQAYLDSEKATIADIKKAYESALEQVDEKIRVLSTRTDIENMPSIIHQQKYQEQIKSQLETILGKLQDSQYKTVNEYLNDCYTEGFLRTMYSMQQQGIPFIMPIDQKAVRRAVELDSKISGGLYSKIVEDVSAFKRSISAEISRGIASSLSYTEIARNLKAASGVPISKASRIVRTEGHRIQNQAKLDTMNEAKEKGADVVKQWDATLDGKTRDTHRELDGLIVEVDEDFEVDGMSASAPGMFGDPAEDCNCRCTCLTRARWALSSGFSKMDNFTKELQTFDSPESYEEFKKDYWSKENIKYMNYVTDMEEKYGTKDFEKVLDSMSDREYEHYQELMKADPLYKMDAEGADSGSVRSDAQKINLENNGNYDKIISKSVEVPEDCSYLLKAETNFEEKDVDVEVLKTIDKAIETESTKYGDFKFDEIKLANFNGDPSVFITNYEIGRGVPKTQLYLNKEYFEGKTKESIEQLCVSLNEDHWWNSKSLDDLVNHEIMHARINGNNSFEKAEQLYERLKEDERVKGFCGLVDKYPDEFMNEMFVALENGTSVKQEYIDVYNEYAKEYLKG